MSIGGKSQAFTSSGTFNVPSDVSLIYITAVSGGSGGCSSAPGVFEAAGAGGSSEQMVRMPMYVTPSGTVAITVGAGGLPGTGSAYGHTGGTSSAVGPVFGYSVDPGHGELGSGSQGMTGGGCLGGAQGNGNAGGIGSLGSPCHFGGSGGAAQGGYAGPHTGGGSGGYPVGATGTVGDSISGGGGACVYSPGGTGGGNLVAGSVASGFGGGGGGSGFRAGQGGTGGTGYVLVEWMN